MTNFEFWKKYSLKWLYIPWLPTVCIVENQEDDVQLKAYKESVAYYNPDENKIILLKDADCFALRFHEYGHWFNKRLYHFLDAVWEFPWWALGVRSLFVKRRN